jgi:hypothetical protein
MNARMLDPTRALGSAYSDKLETAYITPAEIEQRDERLVCEMGTFGDWLAGEIYLAPTVDIGYVPGAGAPQSTMDRFHMRVQAMTVPMLMALALQGNCWAPMAMRTVRERYLAEMAK